MITLAILTFLALAAGASLLIARKRRRHARMQPLEIPLFTIPVSELAVPIGRPPVHRPVPNSTPPGVDTYSRPRSRQTIDEPDQGRPLGAPTIRTRDGTVATVAWAHRPDPRQDTFGALDEDTAGEAVEGASVRYWRVADGTLQFLPGRLAISAGRDAGQEIRFVRTGGPDGTSVTFGRAEGAPYRHVQLREPTVSRTHARMSLETPGGASPGAAGGGRWRLENLSSTNPVLVNGRALGPHGSSLASVILSDGDRIEMGEVAFVFHAR